MDGRGVASVVGALLVLLLTVAVFGIVYVFVVSQIDDIARKAGDVKTVVVSAERVSSGKLYFYLIDKKDADTVTDCVLDNTANCGSFSDIGSKIDCGKVVKGSHILVCSVDGIRKVVWKGYI
jgi:FlaG/FlaF family flagellin (archaellin)